MTKRRTPWRQTTQVCLRVHFETHPDVHTFIHQADTGDICALLRDLLRIHIQQTGHAAGNPAIQKEAAMAGMSHLIDQTISAARLDAVSTPAGARPTTTSPRAAIAQAPAARPVAPDVLAVPSAPSVAAAPLPNATPVATPESVSKEESPAVQIQAAPGEAVAAVAPVPLAKKPGIVGRFDDD